MTDGGDRVVALAATTQRTLRAFALVTAVAMAVLVVVEIVAFPFGAAFDVVLAVFELAVTAVVAWFLIRWAQSRVVVGATKVTVRQALPLRPIVFAREQVERVEVQRNAGHQQVWPVVSMLPGAFVPVLVMRDGSRFALQLAASSSRAQASAFAERLDSALFDRGVGVARADATA